LFKKILLKSYHFILEIKNVVFIASVVFLLHHFTTVFLPFDYMALHLNTALALDEKKLDKQYNSKVSENKFSSKFIVKKLENSDQYTPIVLLYDQNKFNYRFKGITPLDRCILANDLKYILEAGPKVLAIDIDLSPLEYADKNYETCQKKLNKILIKHNNKIVLVEPINENEKALKWKKQLEENGILFANPNIIASLGIVLNKNPFANSLAKIVYGKVSSRYLNERLHHEEKEENFHIEPINYYTAGRFINGKDDKTSLKNKVVFLGGSYGVGDLYLTPIAINVPGVIIHAYDYFSNLHPIETEGLVNLLAFLLDVSFAFIVGFIMKKMWGKYIILLKRKETFSYIIIVGNFFILLIFAFFGIFLASVLLKWNIWFSPIPIIIGVFIDGIISALVEQLEECETVQLNPDHSGVLKLSISKIAYLLKELVINGSIALTLFLILHEILKLH